VTDVRTAPEDPLHPPRDGDRRAVIAIVGAVVVVVGAFLGIVAAGLVPLPDFPVLADDPDPAIPGTVAYLDVEGNDLCIMTVPAGGGPSREVACLQRVGPGADLAWTAEGRIAARVYVERGLDIVVYDPRSGTEVERIEVFPRHRGVERTDVVGAFAEIDRTVRTDGARLRVEDPREGRAVLLVRDPDGGERELLTLDGPRDYRLSSAQWSPDGQWILVADSRGRLIVLDSEGERPRLLAHDGEQRQWWIPSPTWFVPGDATYTVDLDPFRDG
jgi:hypothetical protein